MTGADRRAAAARRSRRCSSTPTTAIRDSRAVGGRRSRLLQAGADCVYQRYLAAAAAPELAAAGVTDATSFTGFYWSEQFGTRRHACSC